MESHSLFVIAWCHGMAAVGFSLYAMHLRAANGKPRDGRASFFVLAAAMFSAGWGFAGLIFALTGAQFAVSLGLLLDTLRYGAWFGFVLALLNAREPTAEKAAGPTSTLAPLAILLVGSGLVINMVIALGAAGSGNWSRVTSIHLLITVVFGLLLIEQLFRNATSDSLWNIKPLGLGLAAAFLYDLFLFSDTVLFRSFDVDAYAVRGFVHAATIPLLWISTSRTQDWGKKLRLSQKVVFHSTTLTLVGAYLLFMASVGYYVRSYGGEWGRALQFALVFAGVLGLVVLVFSGSMRAKMRVFVGKHFFNYRYDYREEWLRFTQTLSAQDSPAAMGEQVIRGLANLVESPSGVLWLRDADQPRYRQSSRWNLPESAENEPADSALCRFMVGSGWVVNLEELRSYPARYDGLRLPDWLSSVPNAWLIVPLMTGEAMIGFVVLGSSRTTLDVNWEVNDLLRTAGRQAASFLAQMQATEALLEVRKFDAFNRMSAFVVHDLKNIVTQLALLLKNAERHSDKPEFQKDMLMTIHHSVERMRQLMLQLREGATPPGTPVGVDLARLVERIAESKAKQGRIVEMRVVDRLMTRGQEERIERVIGHLVQNALDATPASGKVWVSLEKDGGQAKIEVGDTGHGMAPEFVRERLFKPFQTTKQAGMGIGAYESAQYVQELGGKIAVDSEVNVGTRITMVLPMFDASKQSDLRQPETA